MNKHLYLAFYIILLLLSTLPLWMVIHPPLQDYPNHLARMHIILNGATPPLSQYYTVSWSLVPNLAMDIIVPVLARLMPLAVAGKVFIVIIFFLLTSSSIALHYALYRSLSPVPLLGFLVLYNWAFYTGLLNFLFASGLAIWGFAIWIALSKRSPRVRVAAGTLISLLLFFSHLYGLAVYALLVGSYELLVPNRYLPEGAAGAGAAQGYWKRSLLVISQFLLPALLFVIGPTSDTALNLHYSSFHEKLTHLTFLFDGYVPAFDIVNIIFFLAVLAIITIKRRPPLSMRMAFPIVILIAVYFALPYQIWYTSHVDWRILIPLAFVVPAALRNPFHTLRPAIVIVAFIGLLLAARVMIVNEHWSDGDAAYSEFERVIESAPKGSKVFGAAIGGRFSEMIFPTPILHMLSFGVIEKDLFIPSLFATRTQQPLAYKGDYENIRLHTIRIYYKDPGLVEWPYVFAYYDYVLMMSPRLASRKVLKKRPLQWLSLESRAGRFALYRVLN